MAGHLGSVPGQGGSEGASPAQACGGSSRERPSQAFRRARGNAEESAPKEWLWIGVGRGRTVCPGDLMNRRDFIRATAILPGIGPGIVARGAQPLPEAGSETREPRGPSETAGGIREVIRDGRFQRGFRACRPPPGRHDPYGDLAGFKPGPPVWDLVQWSSREALPLVPVSDVSGARTWSNACKTVTLRRIGTEGADLELGVNGWEEYGIRARRDGEPWVHLLIEQFFERPPGLADLVSARFRLSARLLRSRLRRTHDYSPGRHAAQFQTFLMLQNRNRNSAGYGRFLWFGIPLYDDRHRVPPEHKTRDTAGSDMFIFTPPGNAYASASAHDGGWVRVDRDLLPLLREALEQAWNQGFLRESRDPADYRVTGLNLGWEVPGIFDVSIEVRDLSWAVVERPGPG
jgi:hypothetical protein